MPLVSLTFRLVPSVAEAPAALHRNVTTLGTEAPAALHRNVTTLGTEAQAALRPVARGSADPSLVNSHGYPF